MKRIILYLLAAVGSITAYSQSCSCMVEFHFVKSHMEQNHGGFNRKIKSPDEPHYKAFTQELEKEITADPSGRYCIAYLKRYILYLQDHHSNITSQSVNVREDSAAAVETFLRSDAFLKTEIILGDSLELVRAAQSSGDPLEGIYSTPDNTYVIAVVKNKNRHRDYAGVILSSRTKLWVKGQVKLEIKPLNDSTLEVISYLRNHSMSYDQVSYQKGAMVLPGWVKGTQAVVTKPATAPIDRELIRFTILDSSTTLLSIRSFDAAVYKTLDSVYKAVIPQIKKYPHLIIDVRNNGGGSDQSYLALMPFIYTHPFTSDVVDIYNTPANIKAYEDYDNQLKQSASGNQGVFKRPLAKMRAAAPYSFVPMGNGEPVTVTYPKKSGNPVRVAILYNRYCASSCESLLFEAMNSDKTVLVGENSGGYTGYGNVMSITTPCGNQLYWTTTVYRQQWKYELVGIPPAVRIPAAEKDWVEYTRNLLNK